MIGVVANADDLRIAAEFFELFKTPWEPAVPATKYQVVLSSGQPGENFQAELFLIYGAAVSNEDMAAGVRGSSMPGPTQLAWDRTTLPIYGSIAVFDSRGGTLTHGSDSADYRHRHDSRNIHRIGYDLFSEVRTLLVSGQPASNALTPTLDLHIAIFRSALLDAGIAFVEVPPRPDGYDFVCCLTHDVDFFGVRRHGIDRTLMGFVLRGSIGSLVEAIRGRRPWQEARRNWMAVLTLPLVLLNLVDDFWNPFNDYAPRVASQPSTFFLVPFRNRPGVAPDGSVDRTRGVAYQVSDVIEQARDVVARGDELAVHGIDAWRDSDAGRAELNELAPATGRRAAGLRMHWLYFAQDSPQLLERAGFVWDSTCGYNDAIGYRAGTSTAFRPLGAERLLELPLTIMDSAMFYPRRMGLSQPEGLERCHTIVQYARQFGGSVVINWHDRSLAPERLWGWCYRRLLADVAADDRAWFATMTQAADWFNWRRSISFTSDAAGKIGVSASVKRPDLPGGRIVVRRPGTDRQTRSEEFRFDGTCALRLAV